LIQNRLKLFEGFRPPTSHDWLKDHHAMKITHFVRTIISVGSLLLQLGAFSFYSHAAPGDVDLAFDPGSGVNNQVRLIAPQPDGKVIIAGEFNTVRGLRRMGIARINPDGSGDAAFDAGDAGTGRYFSSLALHSDGKILLAAEDGLIRLDSNGGGETLISIPTYEKLCHSWGCSYGINALAVQPDGKILIGGYFRTGNGAATNYGIARIFPDGAIDSGFNATVAPPEEGSPTSDGVSVIDLLPGGKLMLAGLFSRINGVPRPGIARLHPDGRLDESFNPAGAISGDVWTAKTQADGTVLVAGTFTTAGVYPVLARLNVNGSLDSGFHFDPSLLDILRAVVPQPDGTILVAGFVNTYNWEGRRLIRLLPDGSLDQTFDAPAAGGRMASIRAVAVQSNGTIIIGGEISAVGELRRNGLARLHPDGSLDASFHTDSGLAGIQTPGVRSLAVQADGKVLIGGSSVRIAGPTVSRIARLNPNGNLDGGFNPGLEFDGTLNPTVESLVVQADGKVLIGVVTRITAIGTNPPVSLARLNPDGAVDSGFSSPDAGSFGYAIGHAIALQADGKVLMGTGLTWGDVDEVIRLEANGSRDAGFDAQITGSTGSIGDAVTSLIIQPDGKVLAGGHSVYPGEQHFSPLLNRLHADGSRDSGFEQLEGEEFDPTAILTMALQADGKVLIGGNFTLVKGASRNGIARLNADGTLDPTFNPGSGAGPAENARVNGILVQPDGQILIGGWFATFNGTLRNGIARLNADGSLDGSFNPGTGADGVVRAIALQADGNVLIGGDFSTVNGVARPGVARLYGDAVPTLNLVRSEGFMIISWPVTELDFQLQETTNLALPHSWSPVVQPATTNAGHLAVSVPRSIGSKFFRLQSQ
jgi:uncharacterized delta-60 repeat protein